MTDITERVRELFEYDPNVGIFFWRDRKDVRGRLYRTAGRPAGGLTKKGYRLLLVDSKSLYAHRIAWLWVTGKMPTGQIDHINALKDDNRFCNLREATNSQNHSNMPLQKNSTSGVKGVVWRKDMLRWCARIQKDKRIVWVRYFDSLSEAAAARAAVLAEFHGEFARAA